VLKEEKVSGIREFYRNFYGDKKYKIWLVGVGGNIGLFGPA
jgi:hypothetical protein